MMDSALLPGQVAFLRRGIHISAVSMGLSVRRKSFGYLLLQCRLDIPIGFLCCYSIRFWEREAVLEEPMLSCIEVSFGSILVLVEWPVRLQLSLISCLRSLPGNL